MVRGACFQVTPPDLEIEDAFAQFSQITLKSWGVDLGVGAASKYLAVSMLVR